jgi:hypothetical protein
MKYRLLFVPITVLSLAGCSVSVPVYIQNETADSVFVAVQLQEPLEDAARFPILLNTTDVHKARKLFIKGKSDSLLIVGKDGTWHFSIPPKSILLLETGMNFGSDHFRSVKVGEREMLKVMADDYHPSYNQETPHLQLLRKGISYFFIYQIQQ